MRSALVRLRVPSAQPARHRRAAGRLCYLTRAVTAGHLNSVSAPRIHDLTKPGQGEVVPRCARLKL